MNQVIISGRITKDPEIKYTNNTNASYCQFSVAVRNDFRNANGEYDSIFIDCAAFNATAQYMSKYVKKGNMLLIKGKISSQNYQDKDGKTRVFVSINVEQLENLTPPSETDKTQQQPNNPQPQKQKEQAQQPNSFGLDDADDTLPWL